MKVADSLVMPAALWTGVPVGSVHDGPVQEGLISADTL
jgi:hypothetical protein